MNVQEILMYKKLQMPILLAFHPGSLRHDDS